MIIAFFVLYHFSCEVGRDDACFLAGFFIQVFSLDRNVVPKSLFK